jgi:hypothetical protein
MLRHYVLTLDETQVTALVVALASAQVFNMGLTAEKDNPLLLHLDPEKAAILAVTGQLMSTIVGEPDLNKFIIAQVNPLIHEQCQAMIEWLRNTN